MKGEYSESELLKNKGKLFRYYYQGSEKSTSKNIKKVFMKGLVSKESQLNNQDKQIIP